MTGTPECTLLPGIEWLNISSERSGTLKVLVKVGVQYSLRSSGGHIIYNQSLISYWREKKNDNKQANFLELVEKSSKWIES